MIYCVSQKSGFVKIRVYRNIIFNLLLQDEVIKRIRKLRNAKKLIIANIILMNRYQRIINNL